MWKGVSSFHVMDVLLALSRFISFPMCKETYNTPTRHLACVCSGVKLLPLKCSYFWKMIYECLNRMFFFPILIFLRTLWMLPQTMTYLQQFCNLVKHYLFFQRYSCELELCILLFSANTYGNIWLKIGWWKKILCCTFFQLLNRVDSCKLSLGNKFICSFVMMSSLLFCYWKRNCLVC